VTSQAIQEWTTNGQARLAELEQMHTRATGGGVGRRWGTQQLNRSLLVALMAQFQAFCRDLHDEAVEVHVREARPGQGGVLRTLLTQARKLDTGNPRKSALGADFGRLGLSLIQDLKARGRATERRLEKLETLVEFRNAVSHGQEATLIQLESSGTISSTKASYAGYQGALNGLAPTMDSVVAMKLAALLQIPRPW
jgi:hypothetical protein